MAGTLAITTPATDSQTGISTASVTVAWSFTGTSGATQTQRRVVSTPVGGGAAVFDTGMAASTETSHQVDNFATGVSYNVDVSVIDTAGATTTARRVIVSNYTRPLPPTLTVTLAEQAPTIALTNPTDGSRPAVTSNSLYRRLAGSGAAWTLLGTVVPNGSFTDYTAQASTAYEYFARANGVADSTITTTTTLPMMGAWVHELNSPAATVRQFTYAAAATESVDLETAFHSFVGRAYPVPEIGTFQSDSLTVSIRLPPDVLAAAANAWRDWKRRAPTLVYRDTRGRAMPVNIDGPVQLAPDGPGGVLTATLRRIDYTPGTLPTTSYNSPVSNDGGYGVGGYGSNGYGT